MEAAKENAVQLAWHLSALELDQKPVFNTLVKELNKTKKFYKTKLKNHRQNPNHEDFLDDLFLTEEDKQNPELEQAYKVAICQEFTTFKMQKLTESIIELVKQTENEIDNLERQSGLRP